MTAAPSMPARYVPVLRGVARGLPNKRIAAETGLSKSTVGHYVSELIDTLGVANRTGLAVWANQYGYGQPLPTAESTPA